MSVLALRLAGPLQSWGSSSRFTRRMTEDVPTKSGIIGLLAAAQGRRRSDPIEDLTGLQLAVRVDQSGELLRDFHTAHHLTSGEAMPLTHRFYRTDSVFLACIGGPQPMLEGLHEALQDPAFPLYLGRRSCVPEGRVSLGVHEMTVVDALKELPWQAGKAAKRRVREQTVTLPVQADAEIFPDLPVHRELNDVPISFSSERRQYMSRAVVSYQVELATRVTPQPIHDPFSALEDIA